MNASFRVEHLVSTHVGPVALTPERAVIELPRGPEEAGEPLAYGPYLASLSGFLCRDSYAALRQALSRHLGRTVDSGAIKGLQVISQKHGALYHVAEVRVNLSGQTISLALNVAARPEQQAFLENELELLQRLHDRFGLPYLPRPYLAGEVLYTGEKGERRTFKAFLAQWFPDYHEFHLSHRKDEDRPVIKVWDSGKGDFYLTARQTLDLYTQAASILTAYLDTETFEQIYPWHHAAGDFVIRCGEEAADLKLITARDYRTLVSLDQAPGDRWIGIAHFFLNLTLRMRLDRMDGTGEPAWAPPECLDGVLSGFIGSWARKAQKDPSLPSAHELMELLRGFTREEWIPFAQIVLEDGMVEADESHFLHSHLEEHLASLGEALRRKI